MTFQELPYLMRIEKLVLTKEQEMGLEKMEMKYQNIEDKNGSLAAIGPADILRGALMEDFLEPLADEELIRLAMEKIVFELPFGSLQMGIMGELVRRLGGD